jgi:TIR domain
VDEPQPSIFLSHAHDDKSFVRWLAHYLDASGVRVWIDEAEMGVGDSLVEKISGAIAEMDYLGVVISPRSAGSDWVRREVEVAMSEDIAGQKVKVLPLLLRGGDPPPVLAGKLFADFTSELLYERSLARVLERLGVKAVQVDFGPGHLAELASSNSLLNAALEELRADGISSATSDALLFAKVADVELSEFLFLVAREIEGQRLFGLAISIIALIDQRKVGQKTLDACLKSGGLEDWQIASLGMHMQYVTTQDAVLWCHSALISTVRSDVYYHSFLSRHIETIVECCGDDMAAYLLFPNRGPGNSNVESFELAISHSPDPRAFQRRWIEWINHGYFDGGNDEEGSEAAVVLYRTLNEHWAQERFAEIIDAIYGRVYFLMKAHSRDSVREGMYHLVAMVDARYRGAHRLLEDTLPRVYDLHADERRLLELLEEALEAVVAYNSDPSDSVGEKRVRDLYMAIADAEDSAGITGYWKTS